MPVAPPRPPASGLPPTDLPVEACIDAVRDALARDRHAVLLAPPGAGKTTIVPLRLHDAPWRAGRRIVVLEPRRLAARAAARRMASLVGDEVGGIVGFRTRDERRVSRATRIEVVTEGILTRRVQHDPSLPGVGLVVFDEVHERNLQGDLALALVLDARPVLCPELRILAMSATLDAGPLAARLGGDRGGDVDAGAPAPVVTSEGRQHTVDVRWRPPGPRERVAEAAAATVRLALRHDEGDVLVFLAGAADIRRVAAGLARGGLPAGVDVRSLYGALPAEEQDLALAPSLPGRRRVVLATDIAETSLTVEGVRVVVDAGEVRTPRRDAGSGLTRLRTGPSSRASAAQRAGRAGRTGPGVAYRLWSEAEHTRRAAFAVPEIATVDLAGFALEVARWGSDPAALLLLDQPPPAALAEARALLAGLGALGPDGRITATGAAMVELPVHPRLARMIVGAVDQGGASTAAALAALLEERDVLRGAPGEVPTDLADRVRLIADPRLGHALIDGRALSVVRRRAGELERRARSHPGNPASVIDPALSGALLALAYPDRIAQARGGGRFRLRDGLGASLPTGDALTAEPYLVVAELGGPGRGETGPNDLRIQLAAALDLSEVEAAAGDAIEIRTTLVWDAERDDLRARTERRLGALVLSSSDNRATRGPATTAALVDRARATKLAVLRWTSAAATLRARVGFARRAFGDTWPDLGDDALLADLDTWLAPRLADGTGRAALERVDVHQALRDRVGHHRVVELDQLIPTTFTLPGGRGVPVDYEGESPSIAVRVQDLFGVREHPAVGAGRIPLVVHLLSPAGRPVQITADLPGFWTGSWRDVRKELAGRYPKHEWPLDPTTAPPPRPRSRPSRG